MLLCCCKACAGAISLGAATGEAPAMGCLGSCGLSGGTTVATWGSGFLGCTTLGTCGCELGWFLGRTTFFGSFMMTGVVALVCGLSFGGIEPATRGATGMPGFGGTTLCPLTAACCATGGAAGRAAGAAGGGRTGGCGTSFFALFGEGACRRSRFLFAAATTSAGGGPAGSTGPSCLLPSFSSSI